MSQDLIRYDLHVQEALRGVVRRVLADVVRDGLPGEHHFYITFRTQHPGVRLSNRMRAEYPDEMTIVMQHQFWDLVVTEQAFEVGLSFKGVPEKLVVPFEALTGFFDRSVDFGLRFETGIEIDNDDDADDALETVLEQELTGQITKGNFPRRAAETASADHSKSASPAAQNADAPALREASQPDEAGAKSDAQDEAEPAGAQVVQLDAFRKKNT